MSRETKRRAQRIVRNIAEKAKKDMAEWLGTLNHDPTTYEMAAYKAGYLAGLNRYKTNED